MKTKLWIILVIGMLLLSSLAGISVAQETDGPGGTIEAFYNEYIGYTWMSGTFRNPMVDGIYRDSEYLTQRLIEQTDERLANAGDMGIGHDLFLCAQDVPLKYTYEVIRIQSGEALVLMREYFSYARSNNLTLTLVQDEGMWMIDDVTCGDTLTPRGVTDDFYTWYLAQWRDAQESETGGNPLIEGAYHEYDFLGASLMEAVEEAVADREMGFGDPFLCAQDRPQYFWSHDVTMGVSEATVLVQSYFQGNPLPHNLTVNLARNDDQWQITEITCGAAPETMALLLYKQYADQVRFNIDNNIDWDILRSPAPLWDRNVSAELLQRLMVETEGELMADPVLCAQDIPERFTAEVIGSSETSATVQINGEFPSGPGTYTGYPLTTATMQLIEGQWVLTDITCAR